jgi:hypothetical protein
MKQIEMFAVTKPKIDRGLPAIWKNELADTMKPDLANLMKCLLVAPFGKPGRAIEGLLNEVNQLMRMQGVAQENIKAALIIFSVLCSAKTGMPLSIVLRVDENKAVAEHLLTSCLKMVPPSLYIELHNQKIDDLYSAGDHYRNKVLIGRDLKSLKKLESHLTQLLVDGKISIQTSVRTKYGSQPVAFDVNGPVGFIGIENESDPQLFNHPWIIRIPVSESESSEEGEWSDSISIPGAELEMAKIAEYLNRFSYHPVSFRQKEDFTFAIRKQHPSNHIHKLRFAFRMLEVLTILNHPKSLDFGRFLAKMMDTTLEDVNTWLNENGVCQNKTIDTDELLTVGKIEYFMMTAILDEMLPLKYPVTSLLRREIFGTIRYINFEKMKSSFAPTDSILKRLYNLSKTDTFLANIDEIYLRFNHQRIDIISAKNIEKEINGLMKLGAIERKKLKEKNNYGYYISINELCHGVKFPAVADLFCEQAESPSIEVVHPVTIRKEIV